MNKKSRSQMPGINLIKNKVVVDKTFNILLNLFQIDDRTDEMLC